MSASDAAQAITLASPDQGEELQRAELYGLLSRLWLGRPDAALLAQFDVAVTEAPEAGSFLEASWQELVAALRDAGPDAIAAEYAALFQSVGKPDVFLYGSHYLAGALHEKPLAALRGDLDALGLTRDPAGETEDHVAFVLEVMRYLIAGEDLAVCNLERQRRFFRTHVQPWVERLCDTVAQHPRATAYAALAAFTRAFLQVETQAFDMLE